jgi:hypothetical protein
MGDGLFPLPLWERESRRSRHRREVRGHAESPFSKGGIKGGFKSRGCPHATRWFFNQKHYNFSGDSDRRHVSREQLECSALAEPVLQKR